MLVGIFQSRSARTEKKTHVGEEEELRVLWSGPPGVGWGGKVCGAARIPAWIDHKETPPSILPWLLTKPSETPSEECSPGGGDGG